MTNAIAIVDHGRGPQIAGSRLTVMDVFYYLHRGHDFEFIVRAMPSLTREQFDAVADYVREHREELVRKDREVEEFHHRGIKAQRVRGGIFAEQSESLAAEERAARIMNIMTIRHAEKNGARHLD